MEQKKEGKVWLVGAGPSDAELLTLKAKRVLEQAEVVVYDRLVGESILLMMPEAAEKIDAGKRSGNHTMIRSCLDAAAKNWSCWQNTTFHSK